MKLEDFLLGIEELSPHLENFDDFTSFKPALEDFFRTCIDTPWWHPKRLWKFFLLVVLFLALAGGNIPGLLLTGYFALSLYAAIEFTQLVLGWPTTEAGKNSRLYVISESKNLDASQYKDMYIYVKNTSTLHYNNKVLPIPKELTPKQIKASLESYEQKLRLIRLWLRRLAVLALMMTAVIFVGAGIVWALSEILIPKLPILATIGSILIFTGTVMAVTITIANKIYRRSDAIKTYFSGAFDELFDLPSDIKALGLFLISKISKFFKKKEEVPLPLNPIVAPPSLKIIKPVKKQSSSGYSMFTLFFSCDLKSTKVITKSKKSSGLFMLFGHSKPIPKKRNRKQEPEDQFFLSNYLNG